MYLDEEILPSLVDAAREINVTHILILKQYQLRLRQPRLNHVCRMILEQFKINTQQVVTISICQFRTYQL